MILLAIDTATASCSVAVAEDERLRGEIRRGGGQTHSRHLMGMVDALLSRCRLQPADVDALAVTRGPGSFTGIRIGMATAKGLAAALDLPLIGIGSLDALAAQAPASSGFSACLVDARKEEVYCGLYRRNAGGDFLPVQAPFAAGPDEVAGHIDEPCLFIGNGALLYRQRLCRRLGPMAHFAPAPAHEIRAATVARLGVQRLTRFPQEGRAALSPLYVRKSDAELCLGSP